MKIAYLGPEGTFSEEALKKLLKRDELSAEAKPYPSIQALFTSLEKNEVPAALIPMENSIEGPVTAALDLLLDYDGLWISAEIDLEIHQALLVSTETEKEITDLISFPHATAQCRNFILKQYPNADCHQAKSTAASFELMKNLETRYPDKGFAIIGNPSLIDRYPLKVIKEDIQDFSNNVTRFGLVSREIPRTTGRDKSSIVFSTQKDQPGSLHIVLGEFSKREINLSKVVSRPNKNQLGEYLFFIDFEGHYEDPLIKETITAIQDYTLFYRHLGSYRRKDD